MDRITAYLPNPATLRKVPKNAILMCQGDVPQHAYIVQSGCVKVYRISASGDEQLAGFKTAGDIFPEHWVFGHGSIAMYYYEAIEPSTVLTVTHRTFQETLNNNPEFKEQAFDYVVRSSAGLSIQLAALEQSYAIDKILMMLYYMLVRYGVEKKPGEFWLKIRLRQGMIAGLTGLTRETVVAEMRKLKRRGVVQYDTRKFIIYREPLKEILGEETFAEVRM